MTHRRTFSWARILTLAISVAVGAVYGTAATIAHMFTLWTVVPLGLVLAVIGTTALLVALRLLTGDRWAALAAGIGAVGTTLMFSGEGPGGSVIVPAGLLSQIWTLVVPVVVAIVVAWPDVSAARRTPVAPAEARRLDP